MTTATTQPTTTYQLRFDLCTLPGPDWPTQEPYKSERTKDGKPKSCPAAIWADGRVQRYVGGSLLEGEARYE